MDWLTRWLARHPLRQPPAWNRARYTREVMARVQRLAPGACAPARTRGWWWPQLALTAATAALGVLFAVGVNRAHERAAMREAAAPMAAGAYQLAESPEGNDEWLDGTLALLEQLDEEADATDDAGDDTRTLRELEQLDDTELAATS